MLCSTQSVIFEFDSLVLLPTFLYAEKFLVKPTNHFYIVTFFSFLLIRSLFI